VRTGYRAVAGSAPCGSVCGAAGANAAKQAARRRTRKASEASPARRAHEKNGRACVWPKGGKRNPLCHGHCAYLEQTLGGSGVFVSWRAVGLSPETRETPPVSRLPLHGMGRMGKNEPPQRSAQGMSVARLRVAPNVNGRCSSSFRYLQTAHIIRRAPSSLVGATPSLFGE
jgi:hypothetical protein